MCGSRVFLAALLCAATPQVVSCAIPLAQEDRELLRAVKDELAGIRAKGEALERGIAALRESLDRAAAEAKAARALFGK